MFGSFKSVKFNGSFGYSRIDELGDKFEKKILKTVGSDCILSEFEFFF